MFCRRLWSKCLSYIHRREREHRLRGMCATEWGSDHYIILWYPLFALFWAKLWPTSPDWTRFGSETWRHRTGRSKSTNRYHRNLRRLLSWVDLKIKRKFDFHLGMASNLRPNTDIFFFGCFPQEIFGQFVTAEEEEVSGHFTSHCGGQASEQTGNTLKTKP